MVHSLGEQRISRVVIPKPSMDFLATLKTLIAQMLQFSATCLIVWSYPYWSMVLIYEALERVHMKFWKMAFGLPLNAATMAVLGELAKFTLLQGITRG